MQTNNSVSALTGPKRKGQRKRRALNTGTTSQASNNHRFYEGDPLEGPDGPANEYGLNVDRRASADP